MSSVSEIVQSLKPLHDQAIKRAKSEKVRPLDAKITDLFTTLEKLQSCGSTTTFDNYKVPNDHLSRELTLADLQTLLEVSPETTEKIIKYLDMQKNINKIETLFSSIDRIKSVSENILQHVQLFDVQLVGFIVPIEDSPVWFAFSSDEDFLNRELKDLKKSRLNPHVIYARANEIETKSPDLLEKFKEAPFSPPGKFKPFNITIGKLRTLSSKELNLIAKKLPSTAGRVLSDDQVRTLDFNRLSGSLLDTIISSNGTNTEINRRLNLLNPNQTKVYLEKSNGDHFDKFNDTFYQTLALSDLSHKQVASLFDDHYGLNKESAKHHIQLVAPQEISKGFHLLSDKHIKMLSDTQISFLDFSKISERQINVLFRYDYSLNDKEREKRVQLIPPRYVNDVVAKCNALVKFLSPEQFKILDTSQIGEKEVRNLFPGFTMDSLHPGFFYSTKVDDIYGLRHQFDFVEAGGSTMYSYSQKELTEELEKNRLRCVEMSKKFTAQQLRVMKFSMHTECQKLMP